MLISFMLSLFCPGWLLLSDLPVLTSTLETLPSYIWGGGRCFQFVLIFSLLCAVIN